MKIMNYCLFPVSAKPATATEPKLYWLPKCSQSINENRLGLKQFPTPSGTQKVLPARSVTNDFLMRVNDSGTCFPYQTTYPIVSANQRRIASTATDTCSYEPISNAMKQSFPSELDLGSGWIGSCYNLIDNGVLDNAKYSFLDCNIVTLDNTPTYFIEYLEFDTLKCELIHSNTTNTMDRCAFDFWTSSFTSPNRLTYAHSTYRSEIDLSHRNTDQEYMNSFELVTIESLIPSIGQNGSFSLADKLDALNSRLIEHQVSDNTASESDYISFEINLDQAPGDELVMWGVTAVHSYSMSFEGSCDEHKKAVLFATEENMQVVSEKLSLESEGHEDEEFSVHIGIPTISDLSISGTRSTCKILDNDVDLNTNVPLSVYEIPTAADLSGTNLESVFKVRSSNRQKEPFRVVTSSKFTNQEFEAQDNVDRHSIRGTVYERLLLTFEEQVNELLDSGYVSRAEGCYTNRVWENICNSDKYLFGDDVKALGVTSGKVSPAFSDLIQITQDTSHDETYLKACEYAFRYRADLPLSALDPVFSQLGERPKVSEESSRNLLLAFIIGRASTSPKLAENTYGNIGTHQPHTNSSLLLLVDLLDRYLDTLTSDVSKIELGNWNLSDFRTNCLNWITAEIDVDVYPTETFDIPGYLISFDSERRIFHDEQLSEFERSFVIAHEVAHWCLDHMSVLDVNETIDGYSLHDEQEFAADHFAVTLLRCIEGIYVVCGGSNEQRDFLDGLELLLEPKGKLYRTISPARKVNHIVTNSLSSYSRANGPLTEGEEYEKDSCLNLFYSV